MLKSELQKSKRIDISVGLHFHKPTPYHSNHVKAKCGFEEVHCIKCGFVFVPLLGLVLPAGWTVQESGGGNDIITLCQSES